MSSEGLQIDRKAHKRDHSWAMAAFIIVALGAIGLGTFYPWMSCPVVEENRSRLEELGATLHADALNGIVTAHVESSERCLICKGTNRTSLATRWKAAGIPESRLRPDKAPPPATDFSTASEIGAVQVNLGGAAQDGSAKPGWSVWFKDTDASIDHVSKARTLSKLVSVLLTGKGVTDQWIAPLRGHPYVTSVRIFSTSVTDEGLDHLITLPSLKSLSIKDSSVTQGGVAALRQRLPHCRIELE